MSQQPGQPGQPAQPAQPRYAVSAGILLYRRTGAVDTTSQQDPSGTLEVLLGHMGGPYWAAKDERAWSIPKGEYPDDEAPWDAARREFEEETGHPVPDGPRVDLGQVRQRGGKVVTAYALEGDLDPNSMHSNTFEMEWPPHSGRIQAFPEIDRFEWFRPADARGKLLQSQVELVDRLEQHLAARSAD